MKRSFLLLLPFLLFGLLTVIIFKPYLFNHKVPFPGNLLVSFYEPYKSYPWEGYPSGPPNKPIGFDNLRIFYPLRELTIESLKNLTWPLWNPYAFAGNTQLATYQSAVFHPLSFLFFLLPQIDAWSLIVILEPLLAMVFMYAFLQELKLSKKSSVFGAVGFGLSGFLIVNMEESFMAGYSALFLPLILLGIEKMFKKVSVLGFLCVTLGIAFSILSGWFQMTFYILIFAFAYTVFLFLQEKTSKNKQSLTYILLAFFLGVTASAIHLLPSIEAYAYSARGTTDAKYLFDIALQHLSFLITYVAPDFFGNPGSYNYFGKGFYYEKMLYVAIPIVLFGLYGIFATVKKNDTGRFFSIAWIITLSLGFSLPTSWFLLYYLHLPFISTIIPSRIFFLSAFCIGVLAAYGWQYYETKISKWGVLIAIIIIGVLLGSGWFYIFNIKLFVPRIISHGFILYKIPATLPISRRNLVLPTFFYCATIVSTLLGFNRFLRRKIYYLLLLIICVSSIYFANKYLFFSDRQFTFPQVPVLQKISSLSGTNRIWSFGNGYIERNLASYYHLQSPEGYDSFSIQRYSELLYASSTNGRYMQASVPRADAILVSAQNTKEILENSFRLKLLSLLGVKYIIGRNDERSHKKETDNVLTPIWRDSKFIIYRYLDAYPRVFLTDDFVVEKNNQKILDKMFTVPTNLAKTLILEQQIPLIKNSVPLSGLATILSYTANKITIRVTTNKPALLFLSDNYYPGWYAYIDQKQTAIYRTDYSFRSILVPTGKHIVTFSYQPFPFMLGLPVTLGGIIIVIVVCFAIQRYNYRYAKN